MGEGATGRDGGGAVACVFLRIHGITHLETDLARSCEAAWDANIGRGMVVLMILQSKPVHHAFRKLELLSRKTNPVWSKESFTVQKGKRHQGNLGLGGQTHGLFSEILGQITKLTGRSKAGERTGWADRSAFGTTCGSRVKTPRESQTRNRRYTWVGDTESCWTRLQTACVHRPPPRLGGHVAPHLLLSGNNFPFLLPLRFLSQSQRENRFEVVGHVPWRSCIYS